MMNAADRRRRVARLTNLFTATIRLCTLAKHGRASAIMLANKSAEALAEALTDLNDGEQADDEITEAAQAAGDVQDACDGRAGIS